MLGIWHDALNLLLHASSSRKYMMKETKLALVLPVMKRECHSALLCTQVQLKMDLVSLNTLLSRGTGRAPGLS